jgi:MFS family permease
MFEKLAARFRSSDTDYRLLVPLLLSTMLVQLVTAMVRVTTSYRAVELNLSIVGLGLIAAAFAICPILIAVRVGREIDRGYDAQTTWLGAAIFAIACGGFALVSSPVALLVASAVMGTGHIMLMASQQMLCVRAAASPRSMESVFGNYMVAGAIGQGVGPYVVGWVGGAASVPPTRLLFIIGAVIAALTFAVVLAIRPGPDKPLALGESEIVPVRQILRIPGLVGVVLAGVILVASSDIIVIYVPLLGAERNIDVHDIGLLLTMRAIFSMVARLFYARMVLAVGRWPLMIASTFACGLSYAAFAAPLPLWAMHMAIAVMGFSFGLATTLSITIVVDMTSVSARGTTNSLRIMSNRAGQFVLPFSAGLVAAAAGLSGLFLVLAAAISVSAAAMVWKRPAA